MKFKYFLKGHPRDIILHELVEYGTTISKKSDPSIYEKKDVGKAKYFKQNLEATRKAYKKIKDGLNIHNAIKELYLYVKDNEVKKILEMTGVMEEEEIECAKCHKKYNEVSMKPIMDLSKTTSQKYYCKKCYPEQLYLYKEGNKNERNR